MEENRASKRYYQPTLSFEHKEKKLKCDEVLHVPNVKDAEMLIEGGGTTVRYWKNYMNKAQADELYRILHPDEGDIEWKPERPIVRGVEWDTRRQTAFYGNEGTSYKYSGKVHHSLPWTEDLERLRRELSDFLGQEFSYVLLNYYPDGKAKLGWHSDDERDIVPGSTIASLSLGAPRDFILRHKTTKAAVKVQLAHGSLLTMGGDCQKDYEHTVPKRVNVSKPRINLTFRLVRT